MATLQVWFRTTVMVPARSIFGDRQRLTHPASHHSKSHFNPTHSSTSENIRKTHKKSDKKTIMNELILAFLTSNRRMSLRYLLQNSTYQRHVATCGFRTPTQSLGAPWRRVMTAIGILPPGRRIVANTFRHVCIPKIHFVKPGFKSSSARDFMFYPEAGHRASG